MKTDVRQLSTAADDARVATQRRTVEQRRYVGGGPIHCRGGRLGGGCGLLASDAAARKPRVEVDATNREAESGAGLPPERWCVRRGMCGVPCTTLPRARLSPYRGYDGGGWSKGLPPTFIAGKWAN